MPGVIESAFAFMLYIILIFVVLPIVVVVSWPFLSKLGDVGTVIEGLMVLFIIGVVLGLRQKYGSP